MYLSLKILQENIKLCYTYFMHFNISFMHRKFFDEKKDNLCIK